MGEKVAGELRAQVAERTRLDEMCSPGFTAPHLHLQHPHRIERRRETEQVVVLPEPVESGRRRGQRTLEVAGDWQYPRLGHLHGAFQERIATAAPELVDRTHRGKGTVVVADLNRRHRCR